MRHKAIRRQRSARPPASDLSSLRPYAEVYQCPGCARTPHRLCAACGKPALMATLAGSDHTFSWCEGCFRTLCAVRAEAMRYPAVDVPRLIAFPLAS